MLAGKGKVGVEGHESPALLDEAHLVEVIFDASNVSLSCQTHSKAAGKHDVSMGSTVLDVLHRDVTGGSMKRTPL